MLISRLAHPVRNLGFGTRAGIWTQGCTLRCAGCMSRDTWGFRADRELPVKEIGAWLLALPGKLDGVTVSGGEPIEQPELPGLLVMLRYLGKARGEDWDTKNQNGSWRPCTLVRYRSRCSRMKKKSKKSGLARQTAQNHGAVSAK